MFAPGYEWQTVALFAVLLSAFAFFLWRWHTDPKLENFCLVDLIAEDGKLSGRKFMEMGSWVIASLILIVMTIRGTISEAFLLAYCATFSGARVAGQLVHTMAERRTAAFNDRDHDDNPDRPIARPKARASLFR